MRGFFLGSLALCLSCLSCTRARATAGSDVAPGIERPAPRDEAASERTAVALGVLRTRFGVELPVPGKDSRRRCPDETLAHVDRAPLPVRLRDVRTDRRQLLPLRLTTVLTSESALRIADYLRTSEEEKSDVEVAALTELASTRYLAELLVDVYQSPRLFRRKDAPRSEWSSALLTGRLVVYDLSEARPLCDSPIEVRVSGDGQPILKRLRDVTRQRMTGELERTTRAELERALHAASNVFTLEPWPDAGRSQLLAGLSP